MKRFRIVPDCYVYRNAVNKYYELQAKDWWLGRWYHVKSADSVETLRDVVGHLETEIIEI